MAATAPRMSATGLEPRRVAALDWLGGEPPLVAEGAPDEVLDKVGLEIVLLAPGVDETEAEAEELEVMLALEDDDLELLAEDEALEEDEVAETEELALELAVLPESLIRPLKLEGPVAGLISRA